MVSNLTGQLADEYTYADPCYWSRHARSPVRFAQGMQVLAERGCEVFLEIGPSPTLIGMGRRCLPEGDYGWLPSLRSGRDEWQSMLDSLGQLHVRGAKVDWAGFDQSLPRDAKSRFPPILSSATRYWAGSLLDPRPQRRRFRAEWTRGASVARPPLDRRRTGAGLRGADVACTGRRRWPTTRSRAR